MAARCLRYRCLQTRCLTYRCLVKPRHGDVKQHFVVGCYILSLNKDGTTRRLVNQIMLLKPKRSIPILMRDLHANLEVPRDF